MGICLSKKEKEEEAAAAAPPSPSHSKPILQRKAQSQVMEMAPLSPQKSQAPALGNSVGVEGISREQLGAGGAMPTKAEDLAIAATTSSKQPAVHRSNGFVGEEDPRAGTTVRTSSCSKEEVESILIQCGRLSRNSSGTDQATQQIRSRKRSYDFDIGEKKPAEEEEEREKARPSPHGRHRHRRSSSREGGGGDGEHKRSGSRERSGRGSCSGERRMSRSPGRRSDAPTVAAANSTPSFDRSRQPPGKMVSVPAREKVHGGTTTARKGAPQPPPPSSAAAAEGSSKRSNENGGMRAASPRSRSPAQHARASNENTCPLPQPQSLSRSSSRKAEQSPYRRNPMVEIDGNITLRADQQPPSSRPNQDSRLHSSRKADEGTKKPPPPSSQQLQRKVEKNIHRQETTSVVGRGNAASRNSVRDPPMIKTKEEKPDEQQQQAAREPAVDREGGAARKGDDLLVGLGLGAEILSNAKILAEGNRSSSRRSSSSRDPEDAKPPGVIRNADGIILNYPAASSYTSLLLEDIHKYHHHGAAAFSLPACVSKARSILEAVADLNSSAGNSDQMISRSSVAATKGKRAATTTPCAGEIESDHVVPKGGRDPRLLIRKYVDVGGDQPQESAGSNSYIGPWAPADDSVDSTDHWTSSWSGTERDDNDAEGVEELSRHRRSASCSGGCDCQPSSSRSGSDPVGAAGATNSKSLSGAVADDASTATTSNGKKYTSR